MKAIITKYHGPSNTKPSRISAYDGDNRVYVSYDDAFTTEENHANAAKKLACKLKWSPCTFVMGGLKNGYVHVIKTEYDTWEHKG